jgi:LytS/YehU family sensor histidine kinase
MKLRTLFIHVFLWSLFFAIPVFFRPTEWHMHNRTLPWINYVSFIASYLVMIGIYYFNYFILTPRFFFQKKYIAYYSSILCFLVLLLFVPEVDHLFESHRPPPQVLVPNIMKPLWQDGKGHPTALLFHFSSFEIQIFLMGILVMIFSTYMCTIQRLRKTEAEKTKAELSFLKAQINPHFLFNTLNSIYSLAYQKSDKTATAIVKLSGLMRHVISDSRQELVPLTKEVEYISNYIELQRLRLTSTTNVVFDTGGSIEDKMIAPLILLPFIENAFKYGSNTEHYSEITISLAGMSGAIQFEVSNTIVNDQDLPSEGIGVGNARERLELIYPGRHLLNIVKADHRYTVTLHLHCK